MEVSYRKTFLKDLKKLKKQAVYQHVFALAFTDLPNTEKLKEIKNIKSMKGYPNRYRIRIRDYRVGIEVHGNTVEIMRVLHRKEFYRYFP